jgi:predicted RNA methylase
VSVTHGVERVNKLAATMRYDEDVKKDSEESERVKKVDHFDGVDFTRHIGKWNFTKARFLPRFLRDSLPAVIYQSQSENAA